MALGFGSLLDANTLLEYRLQRVNLIASATLASDPGPAFWQIGHRQTGEPHTHPPSTQRMSSHFCHSAKTSIVGGYHRGWPPAPRNNCNIFHFEQEFGSPIDLFPPLISILDSLELSVRVVFLEQSVKTQHQKPLLSWEGLKRKIVAKRLLSADHFLSCTDR